MQPKKRYKHTKAKQVGGNDGYCWTVFYKGKIVVEGLTKAEVAYYRDKFEKRGEEESKQ